MPPISTIYDRLTARDAPNIMIGESLCKWTWSRTSLDRYMKWISFSFTTRKSHRGNARKCDEIKETRANYISWVKKYRDEHRVIIKTTHRFSGAGPCCIASHVRPSKTVTWNIVDVPWEAQHKKRRLPYRHERRRIYGLLGPEGVSHRSKLELGKELSACARSSEV